MIMYYSVQLLLIYSWCCKPSLFFGGGVNITQWRRGGAGRRRNCKDHNSTCSFLVMSSPSSEPWDQASYFTSDDCSSEVFTPWFQIIVPLDICSLTDLMRMKNCIDSLPWARFCHLVSYELVFLELLESLNLLDTWFDLLDPWPVA